MLTQIKIKNFGSKVVKPINKRPFDINKLLDRAKQSPGNDNHNIISSTIQKIPVKPLKPSDFASYK